MKYKIPEHLLSLEPYVPMTNAPSIRMDANESCFPVPQKILDEFTCALATFDFNRYPDPYGTKVCKGFGSFYGVDPKDVVLGNGSDELISIILSFLLDSNDSLLSFEPDFSMYKFYSHIGGLKSHHIIKPADLDAFDDTFILDAIAKTKATAVIFSNPCNPTSFGLSVRQVKNVLENTEALIILDEAYMDFCDESFLPFYKDYDNLIVLKTASKGLGFANMRLGFLINNGSLVPLIKSIKSPYNVNGVTQLMGEIIFKNSDTIRENIKLVKKSRDFLYEKLSPTFKTLQPCANFLYLKTSKSKAIRDGLREKGIGVKALDGYLRITVGTPAENQSLLKAFSEMKILP